MTDIEIIQKNYEYTPYDETGPEPTADACAVEPEPAADTPLLGRSLVDLCTRYSKDVRAVFEALLREGQLPLVLLENTRWLQLAELWQAEQDALDEAQRAQRARDLAEADRRRLFDDGVRLREAIRARELDVHMTGGMIDHESEVNRLAKLERRVKLELEEVRAARAAWQAWSDANPGMAAAVETHLGAPTAAAKLAGPASVTQLAGYEKPNLGSFR
jgi:hypothetical protein